MTTPPYTLLPPPPERETWDDETEYITLQIAQSLEPYRIDWIFNEEMEKE